MPKTVPVEATYSRTTVPLPRVVSRTVKIAGVADAALEVDDAAWDAEEADRVTAEEADCAERKDSEAFAGVVIGLPPSTA
jgi:hypothetical protein